MDMLTGYGSDVSSDGEKGHSSPQLAGAFGKAAPSLAPEKKSLIAALPQPSTSGASLFASIPAAKQGAKLPVMFRLPRKALVDSDDEEKRPKKKLRPSARGKKLTDFLPAPSNDASLALGSGVKRLDAGDSDDEFRDAAALLAPVAGVRADFADAAFAGGNEAYRVAPGAPGPDAELGGNEAYRVQDRVDVVAAGPEYGAAPPPAGSQWAAGGRAAYPAAADGAEYGGAAPGHDEAAEAGADGERLLAEALAAEASQTAKRNKDPFADLGVKFVEVNQEKLRYVNPAAREAMNATRTAFGADYEAKLRMEAGAAPDKLSRRKHQISSLYHTAKMKELEMLDMRGQGLKTKAQTQAKYGW